MTLFDFSDRRVVVTGGARGVGAALLEVLAEQGCASVIVIDRNRPDGPHQHFVEADLADESGVRAAVEAIGADAGPVHALFNNAGVADTQPGPTVFAINYLALRTLSELLLDRIPEGGAIVNTASTAGNLWRKRVEPIDELLSVEVRDAWDDAQEWYADHAGSLDQGPYNFSKEVVERWTMRSSRPTMRRGVRTNAVCPGPIDTPLLPDFRATTSDQIVEWNIREMAGRAVSPREVAGTLAFLASPGAGYISGVNLDIDGGFFAAIATGQVDFRGRG
jgi:NAD(P)-dependent dehydrogenase (short-subunit alcohol dehydrogenase family)